MRQSETDMVAHFFAATDRLMAKEGLHNLSMHKLAKEAGVSAGTIYLYFKNKDELLDQFGQHVFSCFQQAVEKDYDETESLFDQYRRMWINVWDFLHDNPNILSNMHQYQSLPNFFEICKKEMDSSHWTKFCLKGQQVGVLCDLPPNVLFVLGLESAIKFAFKVKFFQELPNSAVLEAVIERSWRSILN